MMRSSGESMKLRASVLGIVIGLAVGGPALAQDAPGKRMGGVLTTSSGMTLYTFDKDSSGKSACTGPCTGNWPPYMAIANAGPADWSVITRDDGSKQWAYKGKPLYTWSKDSKPGDVTGDGFNGVWHAVKD